MPVMNGLFVERRPPGGEGIKVVLTSSLNENDRRKTGPYRINAYLGNPIPSMRWGK
jgi:hypothetical protein